MTTRILTAIPCSHPGCDRPATWHFFNHCSGQLDASTCVTAAHFDEQYEHASYRIVHTKDAIEIVNRMSGET